ncbi:D-glycero-beta-D-manno-heptose 1-phosphate adenylyltransferase [Knoellia sp. CPCC 206435]|uniref:D-glycero-beta-D-manno-heptose 1-phosphate adenylyltransferase n=1 Tax=Knoellia terrae TaxID=3404797 RepID=UPI003B43733D
MSRAVRLTVVGDVVLDQDLVGSVDRICPDAPVPVVDVASERTSPGGAGLTALLAAADGADVTLVAPMADDPAGRLLRADLEAAGITLVALRQQGPTREKVRVRASGQSLLRLDRGGPATPVGALEADARRAIERADVVLVSCYGAGTAADDDIRAVLSERARRAPVLWDPHPKGPSPVAGCLLVTPNRAEAHDLVGAPDAPPAEMACTLVAEWDADAVAVTCGAEGAWVARRSGDVELVAAESVTGDPCGAGDCFAATAAIAVGAGADPGTAVRAAVASAGSFVALGGSAGWRDAVPRPSAAGRTVVATGGCFDVLHAGHVETLTAAKALGDELVVLLNSDRSVRRLKGTSRPLNPAADRATVLRALACVDRVVVFDEDTPVDALRALRPDIWVKGGDYEVEDLPETPVVRSWGGRVEVLAHLPGRSSTATIHRLTQGGHRAS